jgi:GNAT superfamily N-acetyltransferase
MCRIVRPVASLDELAEVFDVIGAQLPQRLTHEDRRFADLVARFPEDRSLMLVIEDSGRLVGGALAFRRDPRGATLRVIGLDPGVRGTGLGRRLVERIESEAARLGVATISLGADEAVGFYAHLGYAEAGGAWHKRLGPSPASVGD